MLHPDSGPLVLLVDDDSGVLSALAATLRWAGFAVLCADTPRAALATALYTETRIDLLVSAVLMSEMTGPELARELVRYHPETRTLFIAARSDNDLAKLETLGQGYPLLAKPFGAQVLVDAVRDILGTRSYGGAWGTAKAARALGSA